MEQIYKNCLNCNHLIVNEINKKHCEQDFYEDIIPEYDLEVTWCTQWKIKVK